MKLSLEKLKEITSGEGISNCDVFNVVTDSHIAKEGDLFIALKSANLDGYDYIRDAITHGTSAALVGRVIDKIPLDKLFNTT